MLHHFIEIEAASIVDTPTLTIKVIRTGKFHILSNGQAKRTATIMFNELRPFFLTDQEKLKLSNKAQGIVP